MRVDRLFLPCAESELERLDQALSAGFKLVREICSAQRAEHTRAPPGSAATMHRRTSLQARSSHVPFSSSSAHPAAPCGRRALRCFVLGSRSRRGSREAGTVRPPAFARARVRIRTRILACLRLTAARDCRSPKGGAGAHYGAPRQLTAPLDHIRRAVPEKPRCPLSPSHWLPLASEVRADFHIRPQCGLYT